MLHHNVYLKDPRGRAEHFRYCPGRPTDEMIVETIRKRVWQIISKGYRGGSAFTTEQLLYPLWQELPEQHHYIGQHISRLIKEYDLPIRTVDDKKTNGHLLHIILFDAI